MPNHLDRHTRERLRKAIMHGQPPCALCGQPINYRLKYPHPEAFVIDHIQPRAKGGADEIGNLQPAHNRCNRAKSDRLDSEILKTTGWLK